MTMNEAMLAAAREAAASASLSFEVGGMTYSCQNEEDLEVLISGLEQKIALAKREVRFSSDCRRT